MAIAEQDRLDDFVDDHLCRNFRPIPTTSAACLRLPRNHGQLPLEPDTIPETEEVDQ